MTHIALAAGAATFAQFAALTGEYEETLPPQLRHANFANELANIEAAYGDPNAAFVASIDGEPCGCVAFTQLDAITAVVKKLYVRAAFRNRGIARALMEGLESEARSRGFDRLVLDTDRERLPAAYNLYRSLGFAVCAAYGPVDYATPTFMQRSLA